MPSTKVKISSDSQSAGKVSITAPIKYEEMVNIHTITMPVR
jgi:hypothetical protein